MEADNIQRSLGRIEGGLISLGDKIDKITERFDDHLNDNQINFSTVRQLVYTQRDEMKTGFRQQEEARNQHLNEQDHKIDAIVQAKAVLLGQLSLGQKIIAFVGAIGLFLFAALQAWKLYYS